MTGRLTTLGLILISTASALPAAEKPNVILFMADDMGMGDTSAYQDFTGNPDEVQIATPHMERLAAMGIRFTDAHTPSSRCSPTRYGLLTAREPWRPRLTSPGLCGSQGDPMIEPGRPTLGTLFRNQGYATGLVGKWHVGLRYRNEAGDPAAGFVDADLTRPLHTTPLDHGFDYCRFTSRSHGTSGPGSGRKRNGPDQDVGPGHIHGRTVVGASGDGRMLVEEGPDAYVLSKLGSRHSDHAIGFIEKQVAAKKPFFLYYPANSNHGPYTPDDSIGGVPVKGASRTRSGQAMDLRHDYIHENDVALGRFIDYLEKTGDPRRPGHPLIDNTIVIFTSDNGAEKDSDVATGPFRSNKGSTFEGGHRVPLLVAWKDGGLVGGDVAEPVGLIDLYATFSNILGVPLPDLWRGEKGGEDSESILALMRGESFTRKGALFFNDHKQSKEDPAVAAMRWDNPVVGGKTWPGQWKLFFDASLIRRGESQPFALYELGSDQMEERNRLEEAALGPLVKWMSDEALKFRKSGGIRYAGIVADKSFTWSWRGTAVTPDTDLVMNLRGENGEAFHVNERGLGLEGGEFRQVDAGEALLVSFDRDVVVESVGIVAGNGVCGGFYQVGEAAPLAIYCVDADNDSRDQQGLLSDIGFLAKGEILRLDSDPHYGVEAKGRWRLQSITVRLLANE